MIGSTAAIVRGYYGVISANANACDYPLIDISLKLRTTRPPEVYSPKLICRQSHRFKDIFQDQLPASLGSTRIMNPGILREALRSGHTNPQSQIRGGSRTLHARHER